MDLCGPISPPSASAETKEVLKKYIIKIKCQTALQVANIISDNGKEFVNTELQDFFEKKGISHLTTSPYTPEQNPFAKRGNRTTITKTRCLLKDSGLDLSFWAKAAITAVYLENLTPSKNIIFDTPFHKWFNKEPLLRHLQPFGCLAIMLKQKKGTGNVKITHHVKFLLNEFPSLNSNSPITNQNSFLLVPNETETVPFNKDIPPTIIQETDLCEPEEKLQAETPCQVKEDTRIQPTKDIHGSQRMTPKPYQEAINGPNSQEWKNAIKIELDNMNSHKVWSPTMPESHMKPLSTTWVFKQKTDKNGNLSKFKARLCV
ncbi:hypothetical protein O181_007200 [Austropuccinia psidii MF-1]|uniref:Integrase catalytic domain-containing protein n=1 Tax=Austropuccinia psidii MF-1 TaxID=1389203 RepID=A0A9Q3GHM1_9BASI|nr:hypothetical protein [Austropuccinia psidii MF-1]